MKLKKVVVMIISGILFFIAYSSVSVASAWFYHRPKVPEELLKKR